MGKAASGAVSQLYWSPEKDGAIAATAPVFYPLRYRSAALTQDTTQIESQEINPLRQKSANRQGTYSVAGPILGELTAQTYDEFLAAAFQSRWYDEAIIDNSVMFFLATDNSINDPLGRFVTAGFQDGDTVDCLGASDPANEFSGATIATTTATKITLTGPTLVDEDLLRPIILWEPGDNLKVGSYVPTYTLVEIQDDVGLITTYTGIRIGELVAAATLNEAAIVTFNTVGEKEEAWVMPGDAVFQPVTDTGMMVTTGGYLNIDAGAINYSTELNFNFTNNMNALFSLFQREAYAVSNGVFNADGNLTAYIPDDALFQKYIAESAIAIEYQFEDVATPKNFYKITVPNVQLTALDKPIDGPDERNQSFTLSAGYDSTAGTTVAITRGTV